VQAPERNGSPNGIGEPFLFRGGGKFGTYAGGSNQVLPFYAQSAESVYVQGKRANVWPSRAARVAFAEHTR
jgi:hypothetical protein